MSLARVTKGDYLCKPQRSNYQEHNYDRGMFISINNHKTHYETILKSIKKVYQSLEGALTETNYSRNDLITSYGKSPSRRVIMDEVIAKKRILLVGGIHNYDKYDYKKKRGSKSNSGYQHLHLYLYGVSRFLPDNPKSLKNKIRQLKLRLMRHNQVKDKDDITAVDIKAVGIGGNVDNDVVSPNSLYEYINYPKTNPNKICCINYIADTMQYNKQNYPLVYVYRS